MNTEPNEVTPSSPTLEIPASQVEVIAKDAPAGAAPAKKAELRTVELSAKPVVKGRATQFYQKLEAATRILDVSVSTGARVVRVMAGAAEHTMVDGQSWKEAFPEGLDVPAIGGVFVTVVVRAEEDMQASAALELQDMDPSEAPKAPPRGVPRQGRSQGTAPSNIRRSAGPRGPAMHPTTAPRSASVRIGPGTTPHPTRTGSRVGQPQNGSTPRRQANAKTPAILSPMAPSRRRGQAEPPPKKVEAPPTEDGELVIRVEGWRIPALRDWARRGVPVPATHVGALQGALRKKGDSPGLPIVLTTGLAERMLHILSKGGLLTSGERDTLAEAIDPPKPRVAVDPEATQPGDVVTR